MVSAESVLSVSSLLIAQDLKDWWENGGSGGDRNFDDTHGCVERGRQRNAV